MKAVARWIAAAPERADRRRALYRHPASPGGVYDGEADLGPVGDQEEEAPPRPARRRRAAQADAGDGDGDPGAGADPEAREDGVLVRDPSGNGLLLTVSGAASSQSA